MLTRLVLKLIRPVATLALVSCSGGDSTGPVEPAVTPVASVTVTFPRTTIRVGESVQASAATLSASASVLSGRTITWTSGNTSVATVVTGGMITAVSAGTAVISATAEGKTGQASLTVTLVPVATITVSPLTASVPVGQATTLTATAKDSAGNVLSGRVVTWVSSDQSRGSVSSAGVVTGLAAGTIDITASTEGKIGSAKVDVTPIVSASPVASVTITIHRTSFRVGESLQAGAIPLDSLGGVLTGRTVVWSSESPDIVSVSTGGLVVGLNPGVGTLAVSVEGKRTTVNLQVSLVPVATVTINPPTQTVSAGGTISLEAILKDSADRVLTGRAVVWRATSPAIASISQTGAVTGIIVGTTDIVATVEGKEGRAAITVNTVNTPVATVTVQSANNYISGGAKKQLVATLRDANGNVLGGRPIAWSSSDPARATVSAAGEVSAAPVDAPVVITATSEGKSTTFAIDIVTFVRLAVGTQFSCGLTADGTAYCWGLIGGTLPTKVAGENRFSTISAGVGHVCALSLTGGTYCWGNNSSGQLGTGTVSNASVPTRVVGGQDFVSVATGSTSTCATNATLEVFCWGQLIRPRDNRYQYDDGARYSIVQPERIGGGIVAVIGGGVGPNNDYGAPDQYCGVDANGLAYCWLRLKSNQTVADGPASPLSPTIRFTTLRMGAKHVCGVATDKLTYCSGNNDQGQLGDGTTTAHTFLPISGNLEFESLAAGAFHSCGVTRLGSAYCWGSNTDGQLGIGTSGGFRTTPITLAGSIAFTGMRGGGASTCGLAVGGAAYCWGSNQYRQLGDGTAVPSSIPRQVFGN